MIFLPISRKKIFWIKENLNNSQPTFIAFQNKQVSRFIFPIILNHDIIHNINTYSIIEKSDFNLFINKNPIQIKEVFNTKRINIIKEFSFLPIHYKNTMFKEKLSHYLPINIPSTYFTQTSFLMSKDISLRSNYILLIVYYYYSLWSTIFNTPIKNIFNYNKENSAFKKEITGDITSGLLNIENLLEAEISLTVHIPNGINIISQICSTCDYSLPYKKNQLLLFSLNKHKNYLFTLHTQYSINYETLSSIISPTINIYNIPCSLNQVLSILYLQKLDFFTPFLACKISLLFFFNAITESLLKQYLLYGITIPSMHFELLAFKMTSFVKITYAANSTLVENDIIEFSKASILDSTLINLGYRNISYVPVIVGITKSVFIHSSSLSSLSFQAMFKYLTKLSLESTTDWLTDIKSNIITSRVIRSGSGWYRHYIKL